MYEDILNTDTESTAKAFSWGTNNLVGLAIDRR